jgi:hypothetical protein
VPKVTQICKIIFGCFLPVNKDSNPCLEDPDFLSPAKNGQRIPIPGSVTTLDLADSGGFGVSVSKKQPFLQKTIN